MKIAWLAPYPVLNLGSAVKWGKFKDAGHPCSWIVHLSNALAAREDVELHILTMNPWLKGDQNIVQSGIKFHLHKSGVPFLYKAWPPYAPLDAATGFFNEIRMLQKTLRRISPDVVHAHGTENPYALAAVGAEFPAVVSMQGIIAEINKVNPTLRFRLVQRWERKALQKAKYASCRTAFDTGFVKTVNPAVHIFNIHEAMNPVYFKQQWNGCARKQLLFVGSLGKHKGLDCLLEAMKILVADDSEIKLCVVGGSRSAIDVYRQSCCSMGIERQVEFLGFLTAEDIVIQHHASRVFVIPSSNENSPNTLAEAMVSGMPCVASAVGGIPSMVDDRKTGLLFQSGDVNGLVRQLKHVLYDDELCRKLGSAAAKIARIRHEPGRVAEETFAAYRFILENETSSAE